MTKKDLYELDQLHPYIVAITMLLQKKAAVRKEAKLLLKKTN